jgi:hypothetical protein
MLHLHLLFDSVPLNDWTADLLTGYYNLWVIAIFTAAEVSICLIFRDEHLEWAENYNLLGFQMGTRFS